MAEFKSLRHFLWTLFLFTYTDFKTIVFPVTMFASIAAPVHVNGRLFYGILWTWVHLLQVDVSNQYKSIAEDLANRPWRPLPSGRISQRSATILRFLLVPTCVLASAPFGREVILSSLSLTALLVFHDEFGASRHWAGKNFINCLGYLSFQVGATQIMNTHSRLDYVAVQALVFNSLIILTTIHAQDFSDVPGDQALGRVTVPIYAPNTSRIFTLVALVVWSIFLGRLWNLGPIYHSLLCVLGMAVGWRFFRFRTPTEDAKSFIAYNAWLLFTNILPAQIRWGLLSF
ncbi:UbiA prenyltransferase family [Roridomyces roridus]|uniref:UbiA prenyltransferase family n=1 Tax=Roridomyces roridus TaxID=1738132 RepID=A0AAD7F7S0_9AGAR|nr:UbiA prenyltransferase family [Roridomyces roridus]